MTGTGSYTFKWPHPNANDVWVAGTFDDWKKTVHLEKKGDVFEKTVELPADKKVLYKFVVDGAWVLDNTKPSETDDNSIANNVLYPSDFAPIATVGSAATTAGMAGETPKEDVKTMVPGAFVETPAAELDSFSVKPIPASSGIGNPVQLAPGEKVPDPSEVTSNTISSTVKTDKESYENADAGPASDALKSAESSVPPVGGTMIPESSLPMGEKDSSPFIQSSGAGTSTADKVAGLPMEPAGVPEIVSESQSKADASPEAAANPEAVAEKKEVEDELKSKVPEEPAAAENGLSVNKVTGIVTGAAAGAAAVATAAAVSAKDKVVETTAPAVASAQETAKPVTDKVAATVGGATGQPDTPAEPDASVPAVVTESIEKSKESPEAAANPVAVSEKKEVEAQLMKEVPVENQAGEPAPTASAATATKAPEPSTAESVPTGDKAPEPAKTEAEPAKTAAEPVKTEDEPATSKKENETPTSEATTPVSDKKSKRKSFFGKIKKFLKEKESK